jgi:hypothetical protein
LALTLLIAAVVLVSVLVVSRGEETGTSVRSGGSSPQPGRSLYSRQDRALMAAVAAGLVPEKALRTERFLIIRLVNQGLIPRETLDP